MKALIFDVDDTLYDQIQPFERALERHIEVAREQIEPLYLSFRRYADEVFEATAIGKMSLKDSHIYRMKHALADFGYQVSDATALAIQIDYDYFQGQIELSPVFPEIFSWCQAQGIAGEMKSIRKSLDDRLFCIIEFPQLLSINSLFSVYKISYGKYRNSIGQDISAEDFITNEERSQ